MATLSPQTSAKPPKPSNQNTGGGVRPAVGSNIGDLMLKRGMIEIGTVKLSASHRRCEAVVVYAGRAEKAQRALKKGGARGTGSMSLPGLSGFYPAIPHVDHAMPVRRHLLIMRDHEDGLTQTLIQVLQHHHYNM